MFIYEEFKCDVSKKHHKINNTYESTCRYVQTFFRK